MTSKEKAESLKIAITQLYSKEGRSISYISRLLEINRKTLSDKIKEWKLPEAEPRHHLTPSRKKFLNKNRNLIKSRLDHDVSITNIAKELQVSRDIIQKLIPVDSVLNQAHKEWQNRMELRHMENIAEKMHTSCMDYEIIDLPNEEWKDILGYAGYMISNAGRVKHYARRYKAYHIVKPHPNKNNGRLYVMLFDGKGRRRNIQVSNLVGHAFVPGYDKEHNTINHEDGNVQNNWYTNLSWQTQSENNTHAYQKLGRHKVNFRRYKFKKILYKGKYEFKTVAAFAKFLGKSETQTRRYLDHPDEHEIILVK